MVLRVSDILEWPNERLRSWLASCPDGPGVNWSLLGSTAGSPARSAETDVARADLLGDVACYALQQKLAADPSLRHSVTASEVHLRAWMIVSHGSEPGTLRDPAALLKRIGSELTAVDHLRDHVANGPIERLDGVPRAVLGDLRHVKNVLRCAEGFLEGLDDEPPPPIAWWWSRRRHLP